MRILKGIDYVLLAVLFFLLLIVVFLIKNLPGILDMLMATNNKTTAGPQGAAAIYSALITVVGVGAALIINPFVARAADDRRIEHDRDTLRAVIYAELKSIIAAYEFEVMYINKRIKGKGYRSHTYIPTVYFSSFESISGSVGLLNAAEAASVMVAYYVYQERMSYIASNSGQLDQKDQKAYNNISFSLKDDSTSKRRLLTRDLLFIIKACRKARDEIRKALPEVIT